MATEIILPKLGQTMEFATVVRWLVAEGDRVEKGQTLLEIETDKAVLEVESFVAGTLLKIVAQPGETYDVLDVLGYVGEPGEALPEAAPKKAPKAKREKPEEAARPSQGRVRSTPKPSVAVAREEAVEAAPALRVSPRAKKLAEEWLLDVSAIAGTGPEGRIVARDVEAHLEEHDLGPQTITPAARELARDSGLTLDELRHVAAGEKITVSVVERALRTRPEPLSPMRRLIAQRMAESARTIPHFYVTMSVDVEAVARWRDEHPGPDGKKVSYNDFIVAACAAVLREMPIVNARCTGEAVQMNEAVNIGVAVSIDDGLVVPVIRNADKCSLERIAAESRRLVERARTKALTPDEMAGGTFSVTNMGMLGVESFGAIIHPEQGAILAVGAVEEAPVVHEGKVCVRRRMKMTLSCDHRIIDGAVGAEFLGRVRQWLESFGT